MVINLIIYKNEYKLSVNEFKEILEDSSLGERRPIHDFEKLGKMLNNADILISAWEGKKLVGVARSISDFGYCTCLSDLAVHKGFQNKGIGKELINKTRMLIDKDSNLFLISAPNANEYYPHIGFKKLDRAWLLEPDKKI